jgi:hypothetical protein
MRSTLFPGDVCVSCKRDATATCSHKTGRFRRCGQALCDDCTHYDDKRWPVHDRANVDRSSREWIAERQAAELSAIDEQLDQAITAAAAVEQATSGTPPTRREVRRARDDLVRLLGELEHQTVVVEGVPDTSTPGPPQ